MATNVKVFVSHRIDLDSVVVKNEVYQPVRCGAVFDDKPSAMPGDDTGVHISEKRESYCELTVQYWAWKNVQADYYGISHYRRYLSWNPEDAGRLDDWSNVTIPSLSDKAIHALRIDDAQYVQEQVSKYDVVTMVPVDLEKVGRVSIYEQYEKDGVRLKIKDLDVMLGIIKEKYYKYYNAAVEYLYGKKLYMGNLFILKKELFDPYCEFVFGVLDEFSARVDMSSYSEEGFRTPGHLGERLFGIFYTWMKQQETYASLELPLACVSDTQRPVEIEPAFPERSVPIVLSSSEMYAPFCSATIQSILNTSSGENNYDLFILHRGMGKVMQGRLLSMLKGRENFSLRFLNVMGYIEQYALYESDTISIESYFRLVIPELISCYDKLLYLDSDLIVQRDVADLYRTDIGESWLGAAVDVCEAGSMNGFSPESAKYVKETLRLKDICMQFNAGVLILNNKAFRENFTTRYLLEFVELGRFRFMDQDALNILCEDHIYWLDPRWNFAADPVDSYRGWVQKYAPKELYQASRKAAKDPFIIHYAGNEKPWYYPGFEYAEAFWTTFAQTPFYAGFMLTRTNDIAWNVARQVMADERPGIVADVERLVLGQSEDLASINSRLAQIHTPAPVEAPVSVHPLRRLADRFFPYGTRRRSLLKRVLPFLVNKEK